MRVPYTNFKTRTGDDNAVGGCAFIGGEWKDVDTAEIFDNKKIVVFALPGAFTPTCSSQQVPGYEEMYDEFKAQGIDEVYCLSVNDAFVMNAWFNNQEIKKVKPIGDGEGVFTQGMGMLVNKPLQGFGMRSWRYSMLVDNGEIIKQFVEEGQNNASDDDDPFEVSDAKTMLDFIKSGRLQRETYFKQKTARMARGKTVDGGSLRVRSEGIKKRQSDKENRSAVDRQALDR